MKADKLLLSDDLRKKVNIKTKELLKIAEKHYKRKFEMPDIRYDIKNWDGGRAYINKNLIRYNLILLVENEEHFIANTVPHEVAHIINRQVNKPDVGKKRLMPHGKEWKDIMHEVFKVTPSVKHEYDCSSIEKNAKNRRGAINDRVERIMKQIMRLNEEDLYKIRREIESILE